MRLARRRRAFVVQATTVVTAAFVLFVFSVVPERADRPCPAALTV
jgi:hypothetical protein